MYIGQIIEHFIKQVRQTKLFNNPTSPSHCHGKVSLVGLCRLSRYRLSRNPPATATQWSKLGVYSSVAMALNAARRLACGCRI